MAIALSIGDARRLALAAQGLLGPHPRGGRAADRVRTMLRSVGAVQLDTISVLARSHELVAYARLGPVGRVAVEAAYWGRPPSAVEYWAHAACVLPIEEWPWHAARRRRGRDRHLARATPEKRAEQAEVLGRLRDLGPISAEQLGGARMGGPWWDWSPLKRAVEELLAAGEVVCVERRGWRRVYDLPERALPPELLGREPDDAECHAHLLGSAVERLGVATLDDLADYYRLPLAAARAALPRTGVVPVSVEGWTKPAYAHPAALAALAAGGPAGRPRTVLLSPFDSLVWHRPRTLRLFDFAHRLEAYTPAALRQHGYFAMPLLAGGRLRGRVDPGRAGRTLVARRVTVAASAVGAMATALWEAASWVGCDSVAVETVVPAAMSSRLRDAVGRADALVAAEA